MTDELIEANVTDYERWQVELRLASKEAHEWLEKGRKVVRRYRDERDSVTATGYYRLNILWANVQTLFPAVYAKSPKADVSRRFNLNDPVGRVAALILERALNFEIEHFTDFDSAMRACVEDRLLPGRGSSWVRYEPTIELVDNDEETDIDAEQGLMLTDDMQVPERVVAERSPVDYVYWEDFLVSPARTWEEVRWVARRVYMSQDEGVERFGEDFKKVPLDHKVPDLNDSNQVSRVQEAFKKAEIYEIWDKPSRRVLWISKGYPKILDIKEDPLELEGFFPCPRPLLATTTTGNLVPVPDYLEYQDQARELDHISDRIHMLDKAIKVVGVYNGGAREIQRMLNEAVDNQLIPVENWGMFAEKGGIKGNIDWLPLEQIINARQILSTERDTLIQQIFQITGISDILRGATDPDETLGAQQIKATSGSLRLKRIQREVAEFASQLIRIKSQIICKFYQPEMLAQLSGITQDDPDFMLIGPALQMLKTEPLKTFRVEANAESIVELDQIQERQDRIQFIQAISGFIAQASGAAETMPQALPFLGKILMFGIRGYKIGRELEGDFEQMLTKIPPPQPKPDPAQQKAQADSQIEQIKAQAAVQIKQAEAQIELQKVRMLAEVQMQVEIRKQQAQQQQAVAENAVESQRDREKASLEAQIEQMRIANDARLAEMNAQMQMMLGLLKARTSVEVAEIGSATTLQTAQISAANAGSDSEGD